ncbi:hypothetical protein M433DRAFT_49360, partial [Acidomyces richmondensis BFW]
PHAPCSPLAARRSPFPSPLTFPQASESRLYTISPATKDALRKFRLGTSRAKDPQAVIYHINKSTLEIQPNTTPEKIYTDLSDLGEDLPDNSPRFILLSYPLTLASGRLSVPYVMLFYLPPTCASDVRMLYAGAKELLRNNAEVGRVLDIDAVEDLEGIEALLK